MSHKFNHFLPSLHAANSAQRRTTSFKAHCYCQFGAWANTSYHVWGLSKVEVGKVRICSTATGQNHCTGVCSGDCSWVHMKRAKMMQDFNCFCNLDVNHKLLFIIKIFYLCTLHKIISPAHFVVYMWHAAQGASLFIRSASQLIIWSVVFAILYQTH